MLLGNRYEITGIIGTGGMGVVYRALDRLSGDAVALKRVNVPTADLIFASQRSTSDLRLSLAQEFRTLASLRHPNIISVLDYGFDEEKHPYYTMELLQDPQDLQEYAHDLGINRKVELLVEALQALAYLHRRGIAHRDLKPDNAPVVNGQIKVLDFGLAVAWEYERENLPGEALSGTLAYMAPEVLGGAPATPSADLYAVGVMAYEMFSGHYPFPMKDVNSFINDILYTAPDVFSINIEPALALVLVRLLSKTPEMRYDNADDTILALCEAIGQPPPPETIAIRESFLQAAGFVGREYEMQQLQAALDAAVHGEGSAWLIGGESGVGKSRLLEELRVFGLVDGMTVLRSQGVANGSLPYQFWREPVRRLSLSVELTDTDAAALKEIVPDIENLLQRDIPDLPPLDGKTGQQRLIGAIVNLFQRQTRPVALLVDDLQWAVESLDVLKALVIGIEHYPLLVVGNYRDDEEPTLPRDFPTVTHIKLERLPAEDIAQLSVALLGNVGQQVEILDLLERETEGNVFFVIEVVRALAEEAGRLSDIGRVTLPERVFAGGIQQIVLRRLSKVPPFAQPLLKRAAVAGRLLDLDVLRAIINRQLAARDDDQTVPDKRQIRTADTTITALLIPVSMSLEDWLTACSDAAVLESLEGEWRFAHDKLREGLIDELKPQERARIHREIALAIETTYPDMAEHWPALAYHWSQSGDEVRELQYAALAGAQQVRIGAYAEAVKHLHRALQLTERKERAERIRLSLQLGEGYQGISNFVEARRLYDDALRLGRKIGDAGLTADALLHTGMLAVIQGDFANARAMFTECLQAAEAVKDYYIRVMAMGHMGELLTNQGDIPAATTLLDDGVRLARMIGDPRALVFVLRIAGKLKYQTGDYPNARIVGEESMALAYTIGDRYHVARNSNSIGVVAANEGNYPEAEERYSLALNIFREIGDRYGAAFVQNNLAFVQLFLGDLKNSARNFYGALANSTQLGAMPVILEVFVGLARIDLEIGREAEAIELLGLALHHPATFRDVHMLAEPALERLKNTKGETATDAALAQGKGGDAGAAAARLLADQSGFMSDLL